MSYCVNCGVELGQSEKMCPLCGVAVMNPVSVPEAECEPAYPRRTDKIVNKEERFMTALLITFFVLLPSSTCLVCEYVITSTISWSLYIVAAMAVLWIFIVPLLFERMRKPVLIIAIDAGALLAGLFVIERVSDEKGWFLTLALPIIAGGALMVIAAAVILQRKGYGVLRIMTLALCFSLLFLILLEIVTDMYLHDKIGLSWSVIAAIPQIVVAIILLVIARKQKVKSSLKKKLHV